jgi:hypothetical protein
VTNYNWGSDLRIAAAAALAPFLCGLLVLLGLLWLGGFGIVLGLVAAIVWAVWWYRRNGAVIPREVDTRALLITAAITVAVVIVVFAST